MLILRIKLKTALDLSVGPSIEEMEFDTLAQIKQLFRNFPYLTITDDKVLKNGVPVGNIYEGENNEKS